MQVRDVQPIFRSKTPDHNVWVGCGIFSLQTAEGSFSSESLVLIARITKGCGCVSYRAIFEGENVAITEKLYLMLSKIFCAYPAREIMLEDIVCKSVEGFELDFEAF